MTNRSNSIFALAAAAVVAAVLAVGPAAAYADRSHEGYKQGSGSSERVHYRRDDRRHGGNTYRHHYRNARHFHAPRYGHRHRHEHKPHYTYRSGRYYRPSYVGDGWDVTIRYHDYD